MLKRVTPPGRLAPGNPKTSSTVFHSPAAFWSPAACGGEIVGSETRRMITAAKVPVLIDDSFVFFMGSSNLGGWPTSPAGEYNAVSLTVGRERKRGCATSHAF